MMGTIGIVFPGRRPAEMSAGLPGDYGMAGKDGGGS